MTTPTTTTTATYALPLGAVPASAWPVRDTVGMRGARPRPAQGDGTAVPVTAAPVSIAPVTIAPVPVSQGAGVSARARADQLGTGVSLGATSLFLLLDDVRDDVQGLPPRGAPV